MNSSSTINQRLLDSFKEGSQYYEFHINPLKKQQQTLPRGHKNIDEYAEMIRIGSDCSRQGTLGQFLGSTNDLRRNQLADEYAEFLLFRVDMKDANYFRLGVELREISRDISYKKQRDHSSHTVNNYLLGWLFYQHTDIRNILDQRINQVKLRTTMLRNENNRDFFGTMWSYVSLFHDIGYPFEGPLDGNNLDYHRESLTRGATWVHNFFLHRFWFEADIDYISIRKILYTYLDIDAIDFDRIKSMIALGDILTSLYNINEIKKNVENINPNFFKPDYRNENFNYSDAFKIWELFYKNSFSDDFQLKRLSGLKKAYYENMYKGSDQFGDRTIDHGVASGLIMLLYTSYFYSIYFNLANLDSQPANKAFKLGEDTKAKWYRGFEKDRIYELHPKESFDQEMDVFNRISNYILDLAFPHFQYHAEWFFTGILWATSAAALHNIQQVAPSKWFKGIHPGDPSGSLWIEDDPLAYLGILVDCLQVWDRYGVFPNPVINNSIPVQSNDVLVTLEDGKLVFDFYKKPDVAESIRKELTKALKDWGKYVRIEPAE